jgi:hypothetical protein
MRHNTNARVSLQKDQNVAVLTQLPVTPPSPGELDRSRGSQGGVTRVPAAAVIVDMRSCFQKKPLIPSVRTKNQYSVGEKKIKCGNA